MYEATENTVPVAISWNVLFVATNPRPKVALQVNGSKICHWTVVNSKTPAVVGLAPRALLTSAKLVSAGRDELKTSWESISNSFEESAQSSSACLAAQV